MKSFHSAYLRPASALCLLAMLGGARAFGQTTTPIVLYTFDGSQPGERLGWSVAGPGDLNGDGVPDVLAGGPGDFILGGFPGIVRAYSGLDGSVLYTVAGQMNADGFGMAIAALSDIDADGRSDFAVGAPYDDAIGIDSGSVYIFSGATGGLIRKIDGGAVGDAFGWSLCDGRDFNGDGLPDLVVGAPLADAPVTDSGQVYLYDPVTGTVLDSRSLGVPLAEFGYAVASTTQHDWAGPVTRYIIAGAPGAIGAGGVSGRVISWEFPNNLYELPMYSLGGVGIPMTVGLSLSGYVRNISPPSWSAAGVAIEVRRPQGDALVVKIEADHASQFSTSAVRFLPNCSAIAVSATSGSTGLLYLGNMYGSGSGALASFQDIPCLSGGGLSRGWSTAGIGTVNADFPPDAAVGDPFCPDAGGDRGRVAVFLFGQPRPVTLCTAKVNSLGCTPQIASVGAPSLSVGDNFQVTASNVLSHKSGLLLWSLNSNSIPFGGGTLCIGPLFHRTALQNSGGNPPPLDCSGAYSFHFSQSYLNAQALTPGVTVYCQFYSRDPGFLAPQNIGLTDALSFTICP